MNERLGEGRESLTTLSACIEASVPEPAKLDNYRYSTVFQVVFGIFHGDHEPHL